MDTSLTQELSTEPVTSCDNLSSEKTSDSDIPVVINETSNNDSQTPNTPEVNSNLPNFKLGELSREEHQELKDGEPSNNNSLPLEVSMEELELLKKLEEANRLIESDAKSLNSLSTQTSQTGATQQPSSTTQSGAATTSGHSRRSSDTSQISVNSGSSVAQEEEADLWTLWGKIINEWDSYGRKKLPSIKDLVRKGIPHHFRGIAWQVLCGAHESQEKSKHSEYMKTTSACEKVIRRDIARTYPEHDFFKHKDGAGQESLFNVMKAYSIHDREVGYCQGSAFIVGLLLMQMPEEDSFAVLVKIMQEYRMREMFKPSMAELGLCMYQLDTLVQEHIPELYVHFQSQAIHTNLYASSWFLTLFTTSLSISLSSRVMDSFLSEGIEVIFRLALTLLLTAKNELLSHDISHFFKKLSGLKAEVVSYKKMSVYVDLEVPSALR